MPTDKDFEFCSTSTRLWCGRIGLLFTVCAVLCTMIFQIWSYYFSLVEQMDEYVIDSPRVHGFVNICNNTVQSAWHMKCRVEPPMRCFAPPTEFDTHFQVHGTSDNIHYNGTNVNIPQDFCGSIWLWILPW